MAFLSAKPTQIVQRICASTVPAPRVSPPRVQPVSGRALRERRGAHFLGATIQGQRACGRQTSAFAEGAPTNDGAEELESLPSNVWGGVVGSIANSLKNPKDVKWLGERKLPEPDFAKVKSAVYVSSAVSMEQLPKPPNQTEVERMMNKGLLGKPEIAVIGRSNVGKSSLINALTNKNGLAMVSKTPGKTRTINHFLINNDWYLVDLPGYGFAKTSQQKKMEWFGFSAQYFRERESLIMVLLLVDGSIPVQEADVECLRWLADNDVPVSVVFTKLDKRKKKVAKPESNILAFEKAMMEIFEPLPPRLPTSSATGLGKDNLLRYLASLRKLYKEEVDTQVK